LKGIQIISSVLLNRHELRLKVCIEIIFFKIIFGRIQNAKAIYMLYQIIKQIAYIICINTK